MTIKRLLLPVISTLCISAMLAGCADNAATTEGTSVADTSTGSQSAANGGVTLADYSSEDVDASWDAAEANYISLKGSSASFDGTGAIVRDGAITIALPGVYVIRGSWDDGQIIVDLESKGTAHLVLNGVNMSNSDSAPIFVKNAKNTIITLQEGTENIVSDGAQYVYESSSEDEPSAAIYSKDDLTINGAGALTVYGNFNDGITGKDNLKITGGSISIYAADDGIVGRDLLAVKAGDIRIEAGGDGMKSTNDEDTAKGMIVLEGGSFDIEAGGDGIQAVNSLLISGGEYKLVTGGGSSQAGSLAEDSSAKGLKAVSQLSINGGLFTIDSADDAVHSNDGVTISDGQLTIASGDDGVHADTALTISGGAIEITKSYEGLESKTITISGGDISVKASDDGVNVAGGNDGSSMNGRRGQDTFSSSGDAKLSITGGTIIVDAAGDGLDSNGSIEITGGTILVNGPTANGNGALDYDGTFTMNGGLLAAAGSSGMAEAPSETSQQPSVMMYYSQTQKAGTLVRLLDSKGDVIAAFAPSKDYQSIVISSPSLTKGESYTFYSGGTAEGDAAGGLYDAKAVYQGGNELVTFTLSDTVTYVNESGLTTRQSSGPGGGGQGQFGQNGGRRR